jgi:hypothetical protein
LKLKTLTFSETRKDLENVFGAFLQGLGMRNGYESMMREKESWEPLSLEWGVLFIGKWGKVSNGEGVFWAG